MKKLVIAAAVLGAFTGVAHAQSSVTLFGVIDTNVTHLSTDGNPVGNRTFIDNSGINTSRLGFRGTEDLGGGLKAGFWLEAGLATNDGAGSTTSLGNGAAFPGTTATGGGGLTFNRRSTVSLISDQWGEIRVGRDYGVSFYDDANVDPFGYNGIAEISTLAADPQTGGGATITRVSNQIMYFTPNNLGGFFGELAVAVGGNPQDYTNAAGQNLSDDGDYYGFNVGYQNGPIYAGVSSAITHYGQTANTLHVPTVGPSDSGAITYGLGVGDTKVTNLGLSYNFGFIKPDFFYQKASVDTKPQKYGSDLYSIGATVPLGQGEFRINLGHLSGNDWYDGSHANLFGVGYVYNLSKRTALYGIVAKVSNSGAYALSLNGYSPTPTPGQDQSGIQLGIRTSF